MGHSHYVLVGGAQSEMGWAWRLTTVTKNRDLGQNEASASVGLTDLHCSCVFIVLQAPVF